MIHGTFAFTEGWWFPGGDFHQYVKATVRPNLYDLKDTFWWSGRYKPKDRNMGTERLVGWLSAKGDPEVDTVFAHSYGGAVALQATTQGLRMKTAVLLSVPVGNYEVEWRNIGRAVSLRIHCDLVLLAARTKQRFTANVEEHWLDSWFVHHGSSHDPDVWATEGWARTLGIG
jgi:pimeloyl-ACP methyl ester carboxylesterase